MGTLQIVCLVSPQATIRLSEPFPSLKFAGAISVLGGDSTLQFFLTEAADQKVWTDLTLFLSDITRKFEYITKLFTSFRLEAW